MNNGPQIFDNHTVFFKQNFWTVIHKRASNVLTHFQSDRFQRDLFFEATHFRSDQFPK